MLYSSSSAPCMHQPCLASMLGRHSRPFVFHAGAIGTCEIIYKGAPCCLETDFWKQSYAACRPDLLGSFQAHWLQRSSAMPGSGTTLIIRMCQWIECETCKLDPITAIAAGQTA